MSDAKKSPAGEPAPGCPPGGHDHEHGREPPEHAKDEHRRTPPVAGADVPGVLDTADAGGKPLVTPPRDEDDDVAGVMDDMEGEGHPEPAPELAPDTVHVETVDGDVLAADTRGGAAIHMDSDGTTIEFTSADAISPARLRAMVEHKDVWNALGRQFKAANS